MVAIPHTKILAIKIPKERCTYGGEYHSIGAALDQERIVRAVPMRAKGLIRLIECCDEYYSIDLTPDEVREFASHLIRLAELVERNGE